MILAHRMTTGATATMAEAERISRIRTMRKGTRVLPLPLPRLAPRLAHHIRIIPIHLVVQIPAPKRPSEVRKRLAS